MIPSMWRVEFFHPLLVHFPIALLMVGAVLRLISSVLLRSHREGAWASFIYATAQLLNLIGCVFAWAAVISGNLAEEEVNGALCDPTITHLHGDYAEYVAMIFTGVVFFDALAYVATQSRLSVDWLARFSRAWLMRVLLAVVSVGGAVLLGYVGHLGASLTYQQGAAVHHPSPECTEFK